MSSNIRGEAIRALSMDARMTVCNMSIEAGARAGMIAPDEVTFAYLAGIAPRSPKGAKTSERAVAVWRTLVHRRCGAVFDREVVIDAGEVEAHDHLGHASGHGGRD
jgi:3-isopropylmalate/(R)-2-methylmalate dehydratase large subunit